MDNWFEIGFDRIMQRVAENSGVSFETVKKVYGAMDCENLTSYDLEKSVAHKEIFGVEL